MDTIKVARIDNGNATRRFLTFNHMPPLKVGGMITVSDGRLEVEGKIVEADWRGNHTLDTAPITK
jgi:hypothetical protein